MAPADASRQRTRDDTRDTFARFRRDLLESYALEGVRLDRPTRHRWRWQASSETARPGSTAVLALAAPSIRAFHEAAARRDLQTASGPAADHLVGENTLHPALVQFADESIREQQLVDHFYSTWTWIISDAAFKVLKDDVNFRRAWTAFQERKAGAVRWAKPNDPCAACRFVYVVALWHGICSMPGLSATLSPRDAKGTPVRKDKIRRMVRKDIERVERHIENGAMPFDQASDRALLTRVLAQKKSDLSWRQPKGLPQRDLLGLAYMFVEQLGPVNTRVFMDIAAAVGLSCDERTAQRYLKVVMEG